MSRYQCSNWCPSARTPASKLLQIYRIRVSDRFFLWSLRLFIFLGSFSTSRSCIFPSVRCLATGLYVKSSHCTRLSGLNVCILLFMMEAPPWAVTPAPSESKLLYICVFHDLMPDNYNDIYNLLFTSGCTCMFPQRYLSSRGEHHYYLPWSLFRPSDDSSRSLFRSHQVFLLFGEPCLLFWVRLIIWLFLLEFISPLLQVHFLELLYLLDFDPPPAIGHQWLDFPERSLQV